ncbi:class I SAM-dependent methyltransferase [Salinisphaera aquimarina]|uniref:Class I SAM-dependent methyltransferase n=1 Tax=Salinisphaera aquimarina TaxID=2094031 RepID=A0ABV7EP88_9GAMM
MSRPTTHARFEADWLTLRESVDHASRASKLTEAASRWLTDGDAAMGHVVDLGSGRGSNLRYLAPRLPGSQSWRLVDHDAELLDDAQRSARQLAEGSGRIGAIECVVADLATDLDALLDGASLVTAAALFDLASQAWMERLAAACAAQRAAVLFVLSVDGEIVFRCSQDDQRVTDADDLFVLELLDAHQQRDKGLGVAVGTRAPEILEEALVRHGYRVRIEASPWHLGSDSNALAGALIEGWRDAATEQAPAEHERIHAWARQRIAAVARGDLNIVVGHRDIFAVPAPGTGR